MDSSINNLIEYEPQGLSQSDFFDDLKLRHPLLIAQQRLDKSYVHRSIADRKRKPERKSHAIVNVNGSRKPWGQFKREFEKEVKERAE